MYLKWHDEKLVIEGEVAGDAEADKEKENIKDGDKNKYSEHDWDPKTCVSVPGSVYGVPMRCSCAHGAFSIGSKVGLSVPFACLANIHMYLYPKLETLHTHTHTHTHTHIYIYIFDAEINEG